MLRKHVGVPNGKASQTSAEVQAVESEFALCRQKSVLSQNRVDGLDQRSAVVQQSAVKKKLAWFQLRLPFISADREQSLRDSLILLSIIQLLFCCCLLTSFLKDTYITSLKLKHYHLVLYVLQMIKKFSFSSRLLQKRLSVTTTK